MSLPDLSNLPDTDLVRLALKKDHRAEREIFDRFNGPLTRRVYRMVKNEDTAKDIVLDTFVRAFYFLHMFKLGSPLGPWLHVIAKQLALNFLKLKDPQRFAHHAGEGQGDQDPPLDAMAAPTDPGRREADLFKEMERIDQKLQSLPQGEREVWKLRNQGMAYEEICDRLQIDTGGARKHFERARKKIGDDLVKIITDPRRLHIRPEQNPGEPI